MLYRLCACILALLTGLSFAVPKADAIWAEPRVYYCTISGDAVDFGTIADTELYSKTLTATIKADCERPFLTGATLLPVPYGAYCMVIRGNTSGGAFEGTRYLSSANNPNDKIYFSFYDAQKQSKPIGEDFSDTYGYLSGSPYINLLENVWGSFNMDLPVNVRLFRPSAGESGNGIAAGSYTGVFQAEMYYGALVWPSGPWSARTAADCLNLSRPWLGGVLIGGAGKSPVHGPITVKATIKSSCSIDSVDSINFGQMPAFKLREGIYQQGAIRTHCSKGASYQVGLGPGLHKDKALNGYRAMQLQGSDDFIAYELFQGNIFRIPWTNDWGTPYVLNVENSNGNSETHAVYGYIPPQESNKKPGVYKDTVVVEIRLNAQ